MSVAFSSVTSYVGPVVVSASLPYALLLGPGTFGYVPGTNVACRPRGSVMRSWISSPYELPVALSMTIAARV